MSKVLVDIDGVLNPFLAWDLLERGFTPLAAPWATWMLHPEHGVWLKEISKHAELVWATSWEEEATLINARFDLPDFDIIHFDSPPTSETLKLPDIQNYLRDTSEPVVWLDDELGDDVSVWAANRGNTLLVHCDPAIGLTREQVIQVLDFLALP